jgi:hypothetical protein
MKPTRIAVIGTAGWPVSRLVEAFHAQTPGSETLHHFPKVDFFVEHAAMALPFAQGERPTVVGCRQALRATELVDQIVSKRRERP